MPAYPRAELEEMVERWLEANRQGEAKKDWRHMADLYTEDATYGWNVGPNDEFMAVGREEIREIALGLEMAGLEGWTYPYQKVLIDDQQGEVIGLWKQVADATRSDGTELRDRRPRRQLVPLRRQLPMVVAAGLLRRRQRRCHLHGDDQGRHAPAGHAAAHGARHGRRAPAGPFPTRRGTGRPLGGPRRFLDGGARGHRTGTRANLAP